MAHLLSVGEKNCSYHAVISAICESTASDTINDQWRNLANELKIKADVKRRIERGIKYENEGVTYILDQMLINWRLITGKDEATLENLLKVLDKLDMNDISQKVLIKFNLEAVDPSGTPVITVSMGNQNECLDGYKLPGKFQGNGDAFILNIIKYEGHTRKGAHHDSNRMNQLLTKLGYKVKIVDPATKYTVDDTKKIVVDFRDEMKKIKPPSIIVYVGCHGMYGKLQASDGKLTDLYKSVVYQFDSEACKELESVPKIFIFQCCRDFARDDRDRFTRIKNALVCFATIPGNVAGRDAQDGSYYVQKLVDVISKNAYKNDLKEMLEMTKVELKKIQQEHLDGNYVVKDYHQQCMYEEFDFQTFYFNLN